MRTPARALYLSQGKVIAFTDHERNKVTSQDQNERKMMPFKSDHSHDDHGDAMSIL